MSEIINGAKFLHDIGIGRGKEELEIIKISNDGRNAECITKDGHTFIASINRQLQLKIESYSQKQNIVVVDRKKLQTKLELCLYNFERRYMFLKVFYPDRIKHLDLEGNTAHCIYNLMEHLIDKAGYDIDELNNNINKVFPEVTV